MVIALKRYLKLKHPKIFMRAKKIYRFFIKPNKDSNVAVFPPVMFSQNEAPVDSHKNSLAQKILNNADHINRILIIGRVKEGDSIATHTNAFLNSLDYNAYDVFLYDEYTHNLLLYKSREHTEFVKNCFAPELDGSFFDVMVYTNVLDNLDERYPFRNRVPVKPSFLSFAYSVFDGTEAPKEWVNIMNVYFDGVLTPCNHLKDVFEKSGVTKPVFALPIALDLKPYTKGCTLPHVRKEYVFGWLGTFEDRKNPLKIIKAFRAAFGDRPDVKLRMHTRYIDETTRAGKELRKLYEGNLPSNIEISEGVYSDQKVIDLMCSFDTYVYVSQGEGYSITPRQAMASGLSMILSAIPTHCDITTLDQDQGVFWIPAQKAIAAVQPSLNNRVCGEMYDIDIDDLTKAFQDVYENRTQINSRANIAARISDAERYDTTNMGFAYRQIVLPNAVQLGCDNCLHDDCIETTDQDLLIKYRYLNQYTKRNIVICPAHDGGFCSVFNKWMSHLVYSTENTVMLPDWRIKPLKSFVQRTFDKKDFTSFCYGTEHDGNLFFRIFQNPYCDFLPSDVFESNIMYQVADTVLQESDFNEKNEPNLTYIHSYNLYKDPEYFHEFRKKYHHYYQKYVKFTPELQKKIDEFSRANLDGKFVISAHIRSAAHMSELVDGDKPTWSLYEEHIRNILKSEKIDVDSDSWRLFIASDNNQSIAHFETIFANHVVSQDMKRLTAEDDREYQCAKEKAGKNIEGFGLQHRAAHDESKWSLQNAYDILFDVSIMAKGSYFVFVNSNISTMVSYVNPDIKMVYCK